MAKRIMNLRDVPAEEAEAVRELLGELGVEWYELPPTAFGLSAGSLWIRNDGDFPAVREAYDRFQAEYTARARSEARPARPRPLVVLGALVVSAVILGVLFWPIIQLAR